jgi:hypothetical protein
VFSFRGESGFLIRSVLYSLLCSMFLMVFLSLSLVFSFIEYACNRFNRQLIPDSLC